MKLQILDAKKAKKGDVSLPQQFDESYRPDLIKRAVLALQANARQPYGADPEAGKRSSAELSRRRRKYRGSYGAGISRVPRKILSRRGTRMYWVGAFAPGTVGGRRAHAPKAEKIWKQKVNTRENRKAIRSALAATMDSSLVQQRGHKVPDTYPFLLDDSFEQLQKTKEVEQALNTLGFSEELARAAPTKVRAGKATMRGRRKKRATSLLIVCANEEAALISAASNIPGVQVFPVNHINAELLAPGTHAGRATLYTKGAIAQLEGGLFLDAPKKSQSTKVKQKKVERVKAKAPKTAAKKTAKAAPKPKAAEKPKATSSKPKEVAA